MIEEEEGDPDIRRRVFFAALAPRGPEETFPGTGFSS